MVEHDDLTEDGPVELPRSRSSDSELSSDSGSLPSLADERDIMNEQHDAEMRANLCRLLTTLRFAAVRRFHAVVLLLRGPLVIGTLLLVGMTLFALVDDGVPIPRYLAFIPLLAALVGVQLQLFVRLGRVSCFPRAQDRLNPPPCLQHAQRIVTRGGIFVFHALFVAFVALEAFPFGVSFAVRAIPLYVGTCAMLLWMVAMGALFVARIVAVRDGGEESWQEPVVKMVLWLCSWGHILLCFLVPQIVLVTLKAEGLVPLALWGAILVPTWIALGVFATCNVACCVSSAVLCYCEHHAPGEGLALSNRLVAVTVLAALIGAPVLVALILFAAKERSPNEISAIGVVSPLFVPWAAIILAMVVARTMLVCDACHQCTKRMRGRATDRVQAREKRRDLELGGNEQRGSASVVNESSGTAAPEHGAGVAARASAALVPPAAEIGASVDVTPGAGEAGAAAAADTNFFPNGPSLSLSTTPGASPDHRGAAAVSSVGTPPVAVAAVNLPPATVDAASAAAAEAGAEAPTTAAKEAAPAPSPGEAPLAAGSTTNAAEEELDGFVMVDSSLGAADAIALSVDAKPQGSSGVELTIFPPLPAAGVAASDAASDAASTAPTGAMGVPGASAGLGRARSRDTSDDDSADVGMSGSALGGSASESIDDIEQSDEELAIAMARFEEGLIRLSYARTSAEATSALTTLLTTLRLNRSLSCEGIRKENLENMKRHGRALFERLRDERGRESTPAARFGEYDERVAKAYGRVLREMSTARTLLMAMQLLDDDIFFEDTVPVE